MNALKYKLLLVTVLFVNVLMANEFQKGKIVFENDEMKEGYVAIPESPVSNYILFRIDGSVSEEKIPSTELKSITVQSNKGTIYEFERQYTQTFPWKRSKQKKWLLVCTKGYGNLYIDSQRYICDENRDVILFYSYTVGRNAPAFNYYVKKKNEDTAMYLTMTANGKLMMGIDATLRRNCALYLNDCPELIKRVDNFEFTHKDVPKLIEIYNSYMISK